jgi:hypothetical protein
VELKPPRERTILGVRRELYLSALATACFLNFYFIQVTIEIDRLPKLTVFNVSAPAVLRS